MLIWLFESQLILMGIYRQNDRGGANKIVDVRLCKRVLNHCLNISMMNTRRIIMIMLISLRRIIMMMISLSMKSFIREQ